MYKNILSQDFHFSGMICGTDWLVTDVSGQSISPIPNGQAVQVDCRERLCE